MAKKLYWCPEPTCKSKAVKGLVGRIADTRRYVCERCGRRFTLEEIATDNTVTKILRRREEAQLLVGGGVAELL